MRWIESLSNSGAVQTALDEQLLGKPYVVYLEDEHRIDWNSQSVTPPGPVYSAIPLTFEILSAGTIDFRSSNATFTRTISYSKDNGATWTSITSSTGRNSFNVVAGDKVMMKGNNATYSTTSNTYTTFAYSTAKFNLYGNMMSLVDDTNFAEITALTSDNNYLFQKMFQGQDANYEFGGLISAENLVLPALVLAKSCYGKMFNGCTGLTHPPKLPATELVADGVYNNLFNGCTSLLEAPELPATATTTNCYFWMFRYCQNINHIKCLATSLAAASSTSYWLQGVSATGTFVKHPNMTSWTSGDSGIPSGWSVEDAVL